METDLASFLAPAGSLLGEVTQRVLEFLSVQDLLEYVASSASSHLGNNNNNDSGGAPDAKEEEAGSPENLRRQRQPFPSPGTGARRAGGGNNARATPCGETNNGRGLSPEVELPRHRDNISSTGAGDEAGGGSRPPTPHRGGGGARERRHEDEEEGWAGSNTGERWRDNAYGDGVGGQETYADTKEGGEYPSRRGGGQRGRGIQVVVRHHGEGEMLSRTPTKSGEKNNQGPGHLLGVLIGLGLHPWAALGALRGGVAHLLGGVPLLALLRWAAGGASTILGVSFRVALLPYDATKGAVQYVVGSLEAMLNVATEIWCELRHLSLAELAVVISCVVSGNALPDFLLNPLDYGGGDSGSSCGGGGGGGGGGAGVARNSRIFSQSSRGTASLESDEERGFLSGYLRGARSVYSDAGSRSCGPGGGGRGAWQQAHAMRRRLDRVNRTASLVSYEERAESAVTRAKAQRVRRRMHYAMSLQCFQATVTVDDRLSRAGSDADEDGGCDGGRTSAEGGSSLFMCTPQSFPPTPVSRAHVMARTSQFSDDVLFLARDQLRLGENLKPGVDETTRATADFLRRQQRLAVLDGNNACEGIVLTCGHHRATKVGPSLYSSARAMVPVLRNRHVYFQVSCMREGPLAPSIGVGLSTPEMPLSTLVGAFSNSVGLCSTGQVLMSSRWYGEPGEFAMRKTRTSTVGVLVYLDGSRPFRSWDGDMVRALVCFSVDGRLVRVATGPVPQAPAAAAATAAALSAPTVTGGGVVSPPLQQQASVYGPPPPPTSPTGAQRPQARARAAPGASATAGAPSAAMTDVGRGVEERGEEEGEVGGGLLSPSSCSPPIEEIAPWEVAAASAAAAAAGAAAAAEAAAAVDEAHLAGGGGGGGGGGEGAVVRKAAPGAAGVRGVVGPAAVPETPAALGLALPKDRDLFPTVTIHSADTEVMCRFCAEDLILVSRESMGAPPGVPVYALDGSLINSP